MIKAFGFRTVLLTAAAILTFENTSFAATPVLYDAAADPGLSPDASVNSEGGATVNAWTTTFSANGGGSTFYQPPSTFLNDATYVEDDAWQLFDASGNNTGQIFSKHDFVASDGSAVGPGQTISLVWANSSIQNSGGGDVGISLKDASNTTIAEFHFMGGGTDYLRNDAAPSTTTGKAFEFQDLMKVTWNIGVGGAYTATVTDPGTGSLEASWAGTLGSGATTVSGIEVFDFQGGAGSDVFYDDLTVVPEAGTWLAAALTLAGCLFISRRHRRIS